jgi:hypothetical protein
MHTVLSLVFKYIFIKMMFHFTNQQLHNLAIFPLTLGLETTCLLTYHELIPLDSHLKITHSLLL